MKLVSASPIWPIGTLLIALSFVGWGISLIVNVEQQQERVRDYVSLIAELTSLENSIRDVDKAIFSGETDVPVDSVLHLWQIQYSSYLEQRKSIHSKKSPVFQNIYPFVDEIDSSFEKINMLLAHKLPRNTTIITMDPLQSELHHEISNAIDRAKAVTGIIRQEMRVISDNLISQWKSLYILVFVSCLLAIMVTVVLRFYQRDLAKRKRTEAVLRQMTAEFRAMFKSIPDAVFFTDLNREIIMVNPAFTVLFGYQPEEIIGKDPHFLYEDKKDYGLFDPEKHDSQNGKLLDPDEIKYRRKNGEIFFSESVGSLVKDSGGEPFGFLNIIRDISKRKKMEEALKEAHEKLEQWVNERTEDLMRANEEVKRFAYIVSHDLRAPLVNIKGFAGELGHAFKSISSRLDAILPHLEEESREELSDILKEEIPEALQFIDTSASRMGHLIDAVLKLSRLGRRDLRFERVDVATLAQQILDSLAHQIEQREVKIRIKSLPRVVADRTSVEQIFSNILVNAVNYLVSGRKGVIEIGGDVTPIETVFFVRDNGRGIAENDMPKVFEPFSRAGNPDVPGEGMGLAYVQTLVRRHGGRIWCESKLGAGTTFYFAFPNQNISEKVLA